MIKKILVGLVLAILVFVIIVAMRPDEFRVERSATIAAPPSVVFSKVNDLREFQKWSPWAKMDPAAKITYAGPATGVGSSFSWVGPKTGEGTMALSESKPDEFLKFLLQFRKPFESSSTADFTFKPDGADGTVVTWGMSGTNNFVFKAMGLFMSQDKMLGENFERGLADLKALSEAKP